MHSALSHCVLASTWNCSKVHCLDVRPPSDLRVYVQGQRRCAVCWTPSPPTSNAVALSAEVAYDVALGGVPNQSKHCVRVWMPCKTIYKAFADYRESVSLGRAWKQVATVPSNGDELTPSNGEELTENDLTEKLPRRCMELLEKISNQQRRDQDEKKNEWVAEDFEEREGNVDQADTVIFAKDEEWNEFCELLRKSEDPYPYIMKNSFVRLKNDNYLVVAPPMSAATSDELEHFYNLQKLRVQIQN